MKRSKGQIPIAAGIPIEVPSMTLVNKVWGSGLRTVSLAAQITKAGDVDIIVCRRIREHERGTLFRPQLEYGEPAWSMPS